MLFYLQHIVLVLQLCTCCDNMVLVHYSEGPLFQKSIVQIRASANVWVRIGVMGKVSLSVRLRVSGNSRLSE